MIEEAHPQPFPKGREQKPLAHQHIDRIGTLTKMFTYFKNAVYNSKPAQQYITGPKLGVECK
jgi:hypothetical protein